MVREGNEEEGGINDEKRAKRKREKGRRDRIRGIGEEMNKRDGERDRDDKKGKKNKEEGRRGERGSREREAED